jgi:chorismate synthase
MMSINAVKGVEIGDGFAARACVASRMPIRCGQVKTARSFSPTMRAASREASRPASRSVVRVAFKPTSSILIPVDTITREGETSEIVTKGRHDPCVGIRGVPVVEAMMALVLADQKLLHRAQCG